MSGYVCLLDRSRVDADPLLLKRLAEPLDVYGVASLDVCQGPLGIAIRCRDNQSGVGGGVGPVIDRESGLLAALSGRMTGIHSRGAEGTIPQCAITAQSALAEFSKKGLGFLRGVAGSFVFLIGDPSRGTISIVRDHLGDFKLYYYIDRRWFIAASEPESILRHPAVSDDLDERSIARFLGFSFSQATGSFFRRIKEVPPAHSLHVTPDEIHMEQYWRFTKRREMRKASAQGVKKWFLDSVQQSVVNQTGGTGQRRMAVSLSGGLDSTLIAALTPPDTPLYSWYFDDIPESDERCNIWAVAQHLGRPVRWVRGDRLSPLSDDYIDFFVHPNSPYLNPFAALKRGLYQAAREEGCDHILVGAGGDVLYAASEYWLRDLLSQGREGAITSLARTVRNAATGYGFARLALRRLIPVRHVRTALRPVYPVWLTDWAQGVFPKDALSPILPPGRDKYRFDAAVGTKHSELESEERRLFAQCGIERGNPFWYWPLLESMLSLPAWWFYRDGQTKVLTRQATKGLLPDAVRNSPRVGLLGAFFRRGIEANRTMIRDILFVKPRSDWQRYVDKSWLESAFSNTNAITFEHTILWRVISYELWYRRLMQ